MKKIWIFIGCIVLMACGQTSNNFVLTGEFENCTSGYAIIKSDKKGQIDTIRIAADGTFTYSKQLDTSLMSFVMVPDQQAFFNVIMVNGTTTHLKANLNDWMDYQMSGDLETAYLFYTDVQKKLSEKSEKEYTSFKDLQTTSLNFLDSVRATIKNIPNEEYRKLQLREVEDLITVGLFTYLDRLRAKNLSISSDPDYNRYMESLDYNNPEFLRNGYTMYYLNWRGECDGENGKISYLDMLAVAEQKVTNKEVRERIFKEILNSYFSEGDEAELESIYAKGKTILKEDSVGMKWLAEKYSIFKTLKPGTKAIDCEWSDPEGNVSRLSDLQGKVIYLDVWATWCGPCCEEIPYLEKLVEHFKGNSNIEFVSVSVDSRQKDWLAKLEKDKPEWKQFLYKNFCELYNINGIPRFIMIDKEGKIITVNAPRPSDPEIVEYISDHI